MGLNNNNMRILGFSYILAHEILKVWGELPKRISILLQEDKGSNTIRNGLEKTETRKELTMGEIL